MKAIILSAGQGSRLGHMVDEKPKCLIDFNGRTLLDRQLDTLEANGVHEAVVVTGFHDDLVEEALAERSGGARGRHDGRLKAIGKRLDLETVNAESIGLLAFRSGGAERFREAIEHAMRTPEGTTIWYLRVIHNLAQSSEVWTFDINGEEWGEVDFPPDVDAARELTARWDAEAKAAAA